MLFISIVILLTAPLSTLLHELGHAVPALLFTRKKTEIYVGTYGDKTKSFGFKIGLLEVWIGKNFRWARGLCKKDAERLSLWKEVIFLLAGPLTSFLTGLIACYYTFAFDLHGALKAILLIFIAADVFYLLINLLPHKTPIFTASGNITYSDGELIRRLLRERADAPLVAQICQLADEENFLEAIALIEQASPAHRCSPTILRLGISLYNHFRQSEKVLALHRQLERRNQLNTEDYAAAAIAKGFLGMKDECLSDFATALQGDPGNADMLSNRASFRIRWGQFSEALADLGEALATDPAHYYAHVNRAAARFETGDEAGGLEDLAQLTALNPDDPYTHHSYGCYHLNKGEKDTALQYFEKARSLDPYIEEIDELIIKAKK